MKLDYNVIKLLEPVAEYEVGERGHIAVEDAAQLSQAVSLKRIADALERMDIKLDQIAPIDTDTADAARKNGY